LTDQPLLRCRIYDAVGCVTYVICVAPPRRC